MDLAFAWILEVILVQVRADALHLPVPHEYTAVLLPLWFITALQEQEVTIADIQERIALRDVRSFGNCPTGLIDLDGGAFRSCSFRLKVPLHGELIDRMRVR